MGQEEEYEPKRVLVLRGCHFDPHPPLLPEPPIPPGEPLRFGVSQREWRQDGGGSTEKWAPGPPRPRHQPPLPPFSPNPFFFHPPPPPPPLEF